MERGARKDYNRRIRGIAPRIVRITRRTYANCWGPQEIALSHPAICAYGEIATTELYDVTIDANSAWRERPPHGKVPQNTSHLKSAAPERTPEERTCHHPRRSTLAKIRSPHCRSATSQIETGSIQPPHGDIPGIDRIQLQNPKKQTARIPLEIRMGATLLYTRIRLPCRDQGDTRTRAGY